jgi:hypothetical protein
MCVINEMGFNNTKLMHITLLKRPKKLMQKRLCLHNVPLTVVRVLLALMCKLTINHVLDTVAFVEMRHMYSQMKKRLAKLKSE